MTNKIHILVSIPKHPCLEREVFNKLNPTNYKFFPSHNGIKLLTSCNIVPIIIK